MWSATADFIGSRARVCVEKLMLSCQQGSLTAGVLIRLFASFLIAALICRYVCACGASYGKSCAQLRDGGEPL